MNTTKHAWLLCLASTATVLAATPAAAQNENSAQAESQIALDEVVVTARRTEERLLDVPLAVTAFSTQQIEERGIRNLDDIAAQTPGLTFSNLIGEFLPVPVIRGVAPVNIFGENSVAVFIDGIFVSGREGLNFSQLDLAEINVVKGPQAALYGRNAFSGAINYVTARPTDEFKAKAELQIGNRGRRLVQASVSGPILKGALQGRLAVLQDEWDGSYDNGIAGAADVGGSKFKTLTGSLRFAPGEIFEGLLSLYVSDDQIGAPAMTELEADCQDRRVADPMQASAKWQNFCGELPTANADTLRVINGVFGEDRDLVRGQLGLRWNLGGGQLSALSGYSIVQQSFTEDGSRGTGAVTYAYAATAATPFTPRPLSTFSTGLIQIGPGDETQEFSQELRFASDESKPLRYVVGVYYYDTEAEGANDGVIATAMLPANFASFCPCIEVAPMFGFPTPGASTGANASFIPWFTDPNGGSFALAVRNEVSAVSGFASLDYDFTERLTGRIEGRYSNEEKTATTFNSTGAVTRTVNDTWSFPSWRANLRYKPTSDLTIYGSIAQAQKSGDFSTGTVRFVSAPTVDVVSTQPFDPEKNLAYELGVKARMLDGRVQAEFDVYYNDWTDVVIPQVVSEVNGQPIVQPVSFEVNAGDASVLGVEARIDARITQALSVNAGVSWTDATADKARLQTFVLFPAYAPTGDVSGNVMLRQSEWQANAGVGYRRPLTDRFDFYLRSDLSYRGKQFADLANQTIVPASTLLNASFGLESDNWTVELWGRNLTHEDAPTGAFRDVKFTNFAQNLPFGSGGSFFPFRWSISHPRLTTYGVTLRFKM
jgi:iron complex outermembrane receptor protein